LKELLAPLNITVEVPDAQLIKFKEALIMAFIGTLRWRQEENVMDSVTGASASSVNGALWISK
jgi:anhydro-N-acetylmuramic acid kinase